MILKIEARITEDQLRRWEYFLRKRYNARKESTPIQKLCVIAIMEAVADEADKEAKEAENKIR